MDFLMYFDFLYGILFDGRIITRKTRKSHRNTENKKANRGDDVYRPPAPTPNQRKSTEYTKRGQGRAAPKERPQPSKLKVCDQVFEGNLRLRVEEWETFFFFKRG